ncbi:alpha/beta hydrolase [Aliivibrio kagoshimensis]|uniref:alpha/beta hydrolase n=1 Tax=Aliivibrio kagoshimensis TaxID=2910230 RepID=UPI003D11E75D
MSDKIYFSKAGKFSVRRTLINVGTRLHHTIAPKHAKKVARKILLTPVRTKPKNSQPQGLIEGALSTSEGMIKTYQLGSGPVWIFSHGWSGTSSQFYPLMEHVAQRGFTALAYDHPGHGASEGKYGHIPGFVNVLDELLDSVDDIAGVVAHSMGTASLLECRHNKLESVPFLLVAPVLNYTENLFHSVIKSGYSVKLFQEVVGEIEHRYQYPIETINPYQRLQQKEKPTTIVHDPDDKFSPYLVSDKAAQEGDRVVLVTTNGQGHGRVMQCSETLQAFDALLER